jgi:predicted homoserine dehydrogenase-like protein
MNLSTLLLSRASKGRPVRAALIGAGKFGSIILSQIPRIERLHMAAVVDLDVGEARRGLQQDSRLSL